MSDMTSLIASAYSDFQKEIQRITDAYQAGLEQAHARLETRLRSIYKGQPPENLAVASETSPRKRRKIIEG